MDLHPEELIEREMRGELSPVEHERLEAHARQCTVCRLERLARADFQRDAEGPEAEVDVQRLLAAVAPLVVRGAPRAATRPRMRHMRFVLVAAAVISVTGLATAARWSGTRALLGVSVPTIVPAAAPVAAAAHHVHARSSEALPAVASVDPVIAPQIAQESVLLTAPVSPGPVSLLGAAIPAAPRAAPRVVAPVAREALEPQASLVVATAAAPAVEAPADASTTFRRANAAREMGDHARAAELYRRLLEDFAASPEARASLPMFGRMLLDDGNPSGALRRFDDALRLGGSALREDVMLGRGLALQRLARPDDEAKAWSALLDAYPSSVHAERARRRLLELGRR
jgi:TolA-binding protein